jgi:hypothetical protein
MSSQSHRGSFGTSDWLVSAFKSNPEGLLLLAAGCALLLRRGSSAAPSGSSGTSATLYGGDPLYGDGRHPGSRYGGGPPRRSQGSDWGVTESMSRVAEGAREYASDVSEYASDLTGKVSRTASSYVSSAAGYADEARRTIVDHSERLAEQAQSTLQGTMERVLKEQPLAVALVGLAAGAAVAAAFPATQIERQTLGAAGEKLSEVAATAGEALNKGASRAGERLVSAAEERGLNVDGLKEVARDVAGAFGSALGSERSDQASEATRSQSGSLGTAQSGSDRGAGERSNQPGKPQGSSYAGTGRPGSGSTST